MNRLNGKAELRLSEEDVRAAIEQWIDKNIINSGISVEKVNKTRSKEWFLVAKLK